MKHGYDNIGAVPVPGTAEVWVLPGYCCMHTPGVPNFSQKKKILGTGRVRVRAECSQTMSFLEKNLKPIFVSLARFFSLQQNPQHSVGK